MRRHEMTALLPKSPRVLTRQAYKNVLDAEECTVRK